MWKPWGLGESIDRYKRTLESKECRRRYRERREYLDDENRNKPDYIEDGHKYYTERYKLLLEELSKSKESNEIFRIMDYDNLEPEEIDDICDNVTYTSHQLVKLCRSIQEMSEIENDKEYNPSLMKEFESLRDYLVWNVFNLQQNFPYPQFPSIEPKGIKNPEIEDIDKDIEEKENKLRDGSWKDDYEPPFPDGF